MEINDLFFKTIWFSFSIYIYFCHTSECNYIKIKQFVKDEGTISDRNPISRGCLRQSISVMCLASPASLYSWRVEVRPWRATNQLVSTDANRSVGWVWVCFSLFFPHTHRPRSRSLLQDFRRQDLVIFVPIWMRGILNLRVGAAS